MTKTGMLLFGATLLGGGVALAYTLKRKERQSEVTDRGSIPSLLNAACASAARGDTDNYYLSVQAAGTLLDSSAQPSLDETAPNNLFGRYQVAVSAPETLELCEGSDSLIGLSGELASNHYDYEAGQVLRIALIEAP